LPLFNGGTTVSGVDEATQQLEITRQENIATVREVLRETKAAFLKTNASVSRIAATQKSLEAALNAKNAMEKGFKYGVQTITDVLLAQAQVYKARKDLLEAQYSYINFKIKFLFMVGLVNEEHLNEINSWLELALNKEY
jgi:outer membrane protein